MKLKIYKIPQFRISTNFKLHHLCCLSMPTYIAPVIYYYKTNKINPQYVICLFLTIICISCSNLFWLNPIKKNIYHKIDGIVAKITYLYISLYTFSKILNIAQKHLFRKYIIEYALFNFITLIAFTFSNYYSSRDWCCPRHIFFHLIFHIAGMLSTIYTHFL